MTFEELLEKTSSLDYQEMRVKEINYLEMVVARDKLDAVAELLNAYFGSPMKPEGENPTREAKKISDRYGGIMSNQTMYYSEGENGAELAMFWPWSGGTPVTVKVAKG